MLIRKRLNDEEAYQKEVVINYNIFFYSSVVLCCQKVQIFAP